MIYIESFPNDLGEIIIRRVMQKHVIGIAFKSEAQINIYLTEEQMLDFVNKMDSARDKWLRDDYEKDVPDRSTVNGAGVEDAIR